MQEPIRPKPWQLFAAILVTLMPILACGGTGTPTPVPPEMSEAIQTVATSLKVNPLDVSASDLRAMDNPKGEGIIVFVPQTRFNGVQRFFMWLVLDGTAYPLNGASKDLTPSLLWPREADPDLWKRTGLDPVEATEAIQIVFGSSPTAGVRPEPAAQSKPMPAERTTVDADAVMRTIATIQAKKTATMEAWNAEPNAPSITVNRALVNVRDGPGIDYPIIGGLSQGETAAIVGKNKEGDWWLICCINDRKAWVASWVVEAKGNVTNVPAVETTKTTFSTDESTYPTMVASAVLVMVEDMRTFTGLTAQVELDPSVVFDSTWREKVGDVLDSLRIKSQFIRMLAPPPKFVGFHQQMLEGMDDLEQATILIEGGIDEMDAGKLEQAQAMLERFNRRIERLTDMLNQGKLPAPSTSGASASGAPAARSSNPAPDCPNPNARITYPRAGGRLSGVVAFQGSAAIPDFQYYKFEYRKVGEQDWRFLVRFDQPVNEGTLMEWHTDTVPTATYEVRLVVVDRSGNYPEPCVVKVAVSGGWEERTGKGNCDPAYPEVCIPPPPPDLDCGDVSFRNFRVLPPDPHRFDRDHDGVGCES